MNNEQPIIRPVNGKVFSYFPSEIGPDKKLEWTPVDIAGTKVFYSPLVMKLMLDKGVITKK